MWGRVEPFEINECETKVLLYTSWDSKKGERPKGTRTGRSYVFALSTQILGCDRIYIGKWRDEIFYVSHVPKVFHSLS